MIDMKTFLLLLVFLFIVWSLGGSPEKQEPISVSTETQPPKQHITTKPVSEDIYSAYDYKNYPRIHEQWGKSWIKKLKELERLAVKKASLSGTCDEIIWVGLSESWSKPKKEAFMFVDCKNGDRFYFADKDLFELKKSTTP